MSDEMKKFTFGGSSQPSVGKYVLTKGTAEMGKFKLKSEFSACIFTLNQQCLILHSNELNRKFEGDI